MIHIAKDLSDQSLPPSLALTGNYRKSQATQQRRLAVIRDGRYPTSNTTNYDNRYRYEDIKQALNTLYHQKCAYCESRERRLQVEHYRPKSHYYWLAYSWDNLLLACSACNGLKKHEFEVRGRRATCDITPGSEAFGLLHHLSEQYNTREQPMLLNPENPQDAALFIHFVFAKDGSMSSEHARCQHTITTCGLNEERTLRLWRGKIVEKLRKRLNTIVFRSTGAARMHRIKEAIEDFIAHANDDDEMYLAFRRYVVMYFLSALVNEVMNQQEGATV